MNFTIPGAPISKKRPRFSRVRGVYDVQSREKKKVQCILISQMRKNNVLSPVDEKIRVEMSVHTALPSKTSQKGLKSLIGKGDPRKPDLDNFVKFYLDAMNKIVYRDDSLVVKILCEKIYSEHPRVEINIYTCE